MKFIYLSFLPLLFFITLLIIPCINLVHAENKFFHIPSLGTKAKIQSVLRSPELLKLINKEVTVEGYYYAGSIPMIIDDIERTYDNILMPEHSYIPIVGHSNAGIISGDRISVKGVLRKPKDNDSISVKRESLVIEVLNIQKISYLTIKDKKTSPPLEQLKEKILGVPKLRDVKISETPAERLKEKMKSETAEKIESLDKDVLYPGRKFAVLIAGGGNSANNHIRYWNDLLCMYQILKDKGYPERNIKVIYHDGIEPEDSVEGKVKGNMPIDFEASRENIKKVFDELAKTMKKNDKLFIMINNHGGGLLPEKDGFTEAGLKDARFDTDNEMTEDIISEALYNKDFNNDGDKEDFLRVDESIILGPGRGKMFDDDFALELNKIKEYGVIIIVMEQCFSGGFIDDLRGPNRIIISAAGPNEISRAQRPQKGGVAKYNEFTYWFFTALMGRTPEGETINEVIKRVKKKEGLIYNDYISDGKISMQEAFNWARRMHFTDDTPHYEDNNKPPASTHYIPYTENTEEEGYLGSRTFLE